VHNKNNSSTNVAPLVIVLFALIVAFHLGNALAGKSLFRASHLGTALEYAHGPINLLRPVIVGFNATGTPTPLELPLWQAAVALLFKATGSTWYGWANLMSLLLFATGLWPFFQLARQYVGERAAWWTMAFFLAQPVIVLMAGKAATDGFCLALTIWFLFFADRMIRSGQTRWWLPTILFACLAVVSKLPFFMAAGFCSVAMLAVNKVRAWRSWFGLALTGVLATIVFVVWAHYCDAFAAQAEYPFWEMRVSHSPFLFFHYFGDLHYRLSPGVWIKGGWRFLHSTVGALPLVALLLIALFRRGNSLPKYWLLATFLTTLVFTHLVLMHWHYFLMCCPSVAMLCGATLARWDGFLTEEISKPWLRVSLIGMAMVFSAIEGVCMMKIALDYDYYPNEMGGLIRQYTKPQDKVILFKCDAEWGGEMLFRAGRKGLVVYTLESSTNNAAHQGLVEILNNEADLRRLKSLGYNKLALVGESPVRFAIEAVNPGSKRQRFFYPATISKNVDAWPVLYRSVDILIKEIPDEPSGLKDGPSK
jgi:hypothetical protein